MELIGIINIQVAMQMWFLGNIVTLLMFAIVFEKVSELTYCI